MHLILAYKFQVLPKSEVILKRAFLLLWDTLFLGNNEVTDLHCLDLCFSLIHISALSGSILTLEPILAQEGGSQEASCLGKNMGPMINVFLVLCIYSCAFSLIIWSSWLTGCLYCLTRWFLHTILVSQVVLYTLLCLPSYFPIYSIALGLSWDTPCESCYPRPWFTNSRL